MLPQSQAVIHSFIVRAAAGSTWDIIDYNLCSVVSEKKELYLFTNTNWIVPGIENVILKLSEISFYLQHNNRDARPQFALIEKCS